MKFKHKAYLILFFLILFPLLSLAQVNDSIPTKVILQIRGDSECPPYEFINKHGNPDGFNVELIRAIMVNLNINYHLELGSWSKSVEEVKTGEADILIGIIPLKKQYASFDFSTANTFIDYKIVCRHDSNIKKLDDLKGKDVLIVDGKLIQTLLDNSVIPGNQVIVDNMQKGLDMLSLGKYDAAICDNDIANYYISHNNLYNLEVKSFNLPRFDMCIATSKKTPGLILNINKSIEELKKSGKYDEIYSKWFGVKNEVAISPIALVIIVFILILLIIVTVFFFILRLRVKIAAQRINEFYIKERLQLKKMNTILSVLPVGFAISDKDGIINYVNESLVDICGIKDKLAHIERKVSIFKDPNLDKKDIEKVKQGEDLDITLEYDLGQVKDTKYFDTISSHKILLNVKIRTLYDEDGDVVNYLILIQNMTEYFKQKEELENFKQNLSLAADAGNLKVWEYDLDKNIIIPIYGESIPNLSRPIEAFSAMIHPDDNVIHTNAIKTLFSNKTGRASCKIRIWNDEIGDFEYTEIEMIARESPEKKITGIVGTLRKIAHEYLLESNYKKMQESLKLVVSETGLDVWIFNLEDQRFCVLTDGEFKRSNLTFANLLCHIHPDDTDDFHSMMTSLVDGEITSGIISYRIRYFTQTNYIKIRCHINAISGTDGKIIHLIASCSKLPKQ